MRTTTHTGSATARLFALVVALIAGAASLFGGALPAYAATGSFSFNTAAITVNEGNDATVTVNRAGGSGGPIQVGWHTEAITAAPGEFSVTSGFLTFTDPGVNSQSISVNTANVTGNKTFKFVLDSANNGGTIGAVDEVIVTIQDLQSLAPSVSSVSPASGTMSGGTLVTISGSGFTGSTCALVTFGATPIVGCTVTANQITGITPAHAAGVVDVAVTTPNGTSANTAADNFTYVTAGAPTITSISPTSGSSAGGTGIQINGTNLNGATSITVGGNTCTGAIIAASTITCSTPAKGANSSVVDVRVTTPAGITPNTASDNFTYVGTPVFTSITPQFGPTTGGTLITIFGSNLTGTTNVQLGGSACTGPVVQASSVQCTTTAHLAGLVSVTATNGAGNPSLLNSYTYTDSLTPTITSIVPASCLVGGGSTVTINGTGFINGGTSVTFGGVTVLPSSVSGATSLTVVCPAQAGAGVVDVRVTVGAVTSPNTVADDFTYGNLTVTITSVTPAAGSIFGQNQVVIAGSNFTNVQSVSFGAFAALSYTVNGPTSITAIAPPQSAGTVDIVVTTLTGINTTVGSQNDYTYTAGPTVTNLNPNTGPASGTTIVTITGTNFSNSGLVVRFGGVIATSNFINATTIIAVAPAQSAGLVDVIVTTAGGVSPNTLADDYTYTGSGVPVITSISPTSGPAGTVVTLTGSGFIGTTTVTFGGTNASFNVTNNTTLTATVPAGAPGGTIDIRVTNGSGTSVNTTADNFNNTSNTATVTYTLYFRWTLIAWSGIDNISVTAALSGNESPDNPATNNILGQVTVIWWWDAAAQVYRGNFPGSSAPGANDFTTLRRGNSYWFAIAGPNTQQWTVVQGN